jgi:hypothetical protein
MLLVEAGGGLAGVAGEDSGVGAVGALVPVDAAEGHVDGRALGAAVYTMLSGRFDRVP